MTTTGGDAAVAASGASDSGGGGGGGSSGSGPGSEKLKRIGDWIFGETLGQGSFGKVKLAHHAKTKEKVAIKIVDKSGIANVEDVERVYRETFILTTLKHTNIIKLFEVLDTPRSIMLVMEYAGGGELFSYVAAKHRLGEVESCRLFQQIISGVECEEQQQRNMARHAAQRDAVAGNHDACTPRSDDAASSMCRSITLAGWAGNAAVAVAHSVLCVPLTPLSLCIRFCTCCSPSHRLPPRQDHPSRSQIRSVEEPRGACARRRSRLALSRVRSLRLLIVPLLSLPLVFFALRSSLLRKHSPR